LRKNVDGNDQLQGYDGNDTIDGGTGANVEAGGNGIDTADYSDRTNPVVIDIAYGEHYSDSGEAGESDLGGSDTIVKDSIER
jgi:Ca2+-binding RTX toxin-like protein